MTGLANRRGFDDALAREWRRCARSGLPLSLVLLDIDLFKRFNDAYGHVAGDACLRQVAEAFARHAKRPGDLAARYGGEEFALILPESDAGGSFRVGESVQRALRELAIPHEGSSLGCVTASIGIATLSPDIDENPQTLVRAADAMLYEAKREGRNAIASAEERCAGAPVTDRVIVRYALPRYGTGMIGRRREFAEVTSLVASSQVVTIVGAGGIGKTRLAVESALHQVGQQRDGTWFVDLAPLAAGDSIAASVADAIGIELPSTPDPLASIVALLRPRAMLVVLDNCEHLVAEAAALTAAIARDCPNVRVLATSREALGVEGESVYRLDTLDDDAAVELFIARARRADQGVSISHADRPVVADICRQLDGVALAIELAAARAHVMPLEQLRSRLDERFRLLTGGNRTARARQQTMLASIEWSFDLLSETERAVFRRIGVFSGSFTLQAAARVAAGESMPAWEATGSVMALIDKSMLARWGAGVDRYRMLESIRQYAVHKLCEAGEEADARHAHAIAFAELSSEVAATYGHITQDTWMERYEPDAENFRAAFDWSLTSNLAAAAALDGNLPEFWDYCGLVPAALRRSEALLAALGVGAEDAVLARSLLSVALLANNVRNHRRALETGERALSIARRLGDALLLARTLRLTGGANWIAGDRERGEAQLAEALGYFRSLGNPLRTVSTLYLYGITQGSAKGRPLMLEALSMAQSAGWPKLTVAIEMNLAEHDFWEGDLPGAAERARRALAMIRWRHGASERAHVLVNLASYACIAAEYGEAREAATEAASIAHELEQGYVLALALQSLAVVHASRNDARRAATLLGYVDAVYAKLGTPRERTEALVNERLLELLRDRLDHAALAAQTASGASLTAAAAYVLACGNDS